MYCIEFMFGKKKPGELSLYRKLKKRLSISKYIAMQTRWSQFPRSVQICVLIYKPASHPFKTTHDARARPSVNEENSRYS